MTAPVLGRQRQLNQAPDRPIRAQHRLGQLKQRIRPRRKAAVKSARKAASRSRARSSSGPGSTPPPSHAILNATATAIISGLCGRNPKMITRWLCHVMAARQDKITNLGKAGPRG